MINNYEKIRRYAKKIGYTLKRTSSTGACKRSTGFFGEYVCIKDQSHIVIDHKRKTVRGCCLEHAKSSIRKRKSKSILSREKDLELTSVDWL